MAGRRAHYRKPAPPTTAPKIIDDPSLPIDVILFGPRDGMVPPDQNPPATPPDDRVSTQKEPVPMTTPTPSTQLAKPGAAGPLDLTAMPTFLQGAFEPDEWAAMSDDDKIGALALWSEEQQETTEGVEITFPRVKYPTSGSSFWEKAGLDGEPDAMRTLEGIVIFKQPVRAYWPLDQEVGKNPPTCSSLDGVKPVEGPSQVAPTCGGCPFSQWGSGKDGVGQACKARLNVFLQFPEEEIPTLVSLPPSALKTFATFAVALRQAKSPLLAVTTVFGLTDATSGKGVAYKALTLKIGRKLAFAEMKVARALREVFEQQMAKRGVKVDEVVEETPPGAAGEHELLDKDGKKVPL